MWACPVCKQALDEQGTRFCCQNGHSFDKASSGYVNLLLANKKHSAVPGDNKQMVHARTLFLNTGAYALFGRALASQVLALTQKKRLPLVLDAGCGEGYYTGLVADAFLEAGKECTLAGVDISKYACQAAAKRVKSAHFATASAFDLPVLDACADVLLSVFAPISPAEFARVIQPGGYLVLGVAGKRHLWGLKQVLYEHPYENDETLPDLPGFAKINRQSVRYEIDVQPSEQIAALFSMTPYAYKTAPQAAQKLLGLQKLHTTVEFELYTFEKL